MSRLADRSIGQTIDPNRVPSQTDYVIDGVTYGFKTAKQVPCGKAKTKKNLVDQKNWMSYAPRALGQSFFKDVSRPFKKHEHMLIWDYLA